MCHKSLSSVSHLSAQVSRKCTSYLSPLQQMVLAASFMHYLNIKWEWAGLCCKQTSGEQHGLSLTTSWLLLEFCVEVTHGRISLFHSVPVKGRFHLLLWISVFLNTFSHSRRRICLFALTAVAHLGNIFMHEWHVPWGKAAGAKSCVLVSCQFFAKIWKLLITGKKHTVLKTAELQTWVIIYSPWCCSKPVWRA